MSIGLVNNPHLSHPIQTVRIMPNKFVPQVTAKEFHALWLLVQSINVFDNGTLNSISQNVLVNSDEADIQNLLQLGESLGIVEQNSSKWLLTPQGERFKNSSHWRLWKPPQQVQSFLNEKNLSHLFIDKKQYEHRPVIIDLFAGVGGLSLGFTAAGFNVALAIDDDAQAYEAHKKNFPETLVTQDDINEFADNPSGYLSEVIPHLKDIKISGIIGGPPCQGFSYIGERDTEDERNLLTSKFMDIVLALKPDFFMMENVPGLATSGISPKFDIYIKRLAKAKGKPASLIVDQLPSVPKEVAKRDRQFRKRVVSSVIDTVRDIAENRLANMLPEPIEIKNNVEWVYTQLKEITQNTITNKYDSQTSQDIVNNSKEEVCSLAIALVFDVLLTSKKIKSSDTRKYFQQLQMLFSDIGPFYRTISSLCDDYDNTPTAGTFKETKVGPILLHLLERASEFYDIPAPKVLNAASFGTPQDRERMFLVGIRKDLRKTFIYPEPTHSLNGNGAKPQVPNVHQALHDLPDIDSIPHLLEDHEFSTNEMGQAETDFVKAMRFELITPSDFSMPPISWNPYLVDSSNRTIHQDHVKKRLETLGPGKQDKISRRTRLHPDRLSPTLRAGTKEKKGSHTAVPPIHYEYHRVISVREGARLMGYPDWMTFHKAKWHGFRLVGNGVPFPLSNAIAKQIKKLLYEPKT